MCRVHAVRLQLTGVAVSGKPLAFSLRGVDDELNPVPVARISRRTIHWRFDDPRGGRRSISFVVLVESLRRRIRRFSFVEDASNLCMRRSFRVHRIRPPDPKDRYCIAFGRVCGLCLAVPESFALACRWIWPSDEGPSFASGEDFQGFVRQVDIGARRRASSLVSFAPFVPCTPISPPLRCC